MMEKAIALSKKADPYPNPKVGAVIVKDGKIIGKGYHKKAGEDHAEIAALKAAGSNANGATLYVTLEPCSHKKKRTPPCTEAIIKAGISKVVFGMKDPNPKVRGASILRKAGIAVEGPSDQERISEINSEYVDTLGTVVAIKMAMSLDGKTATRTGDSKWISSEHSRKMVHRLRAEYDAVMVGANTVIRDRPKLTSRGGKDPVKIIVDGKLRVPVNSPTLKDAIVVTGGKADPKKMGKIEEKARIIQFEGEIDFRRLLRILSGMGIKRILVEGGSELNASVLPIARKFYIFVAPIVIGGKDALPVIGGEGISLIKEARKARNLMISRFERDILLEFEI